MLTQIVNRVNKAFSNIDIPKNDAPHHFNSPKVTPRNLRILSEYQYYYYKPFTKIKCKKYAAWNAIFSKATEGQVLKYSTGSRLLHRQ